MIVNPVVSAGGAVVLRAQNQSSDPSDPMLYIYYTDGSEESKRKVLYVGEETDIEVQKNSFIYSYVAAMGSMAEIESYSGGIKPIADYVYFIYGDATISVLT